MTLRGALWSEDTQVMADALRKAGIKLEIEQDPQEDANRTFHLQGMGDNRLQGGTLSHPIEIYVGNSGRNPTHRRKDDRTLVQRRLHRSYRNRALQEVILGAYVTIENNGRKLHSPAIIISAFGIMNELNVPTLATSFS